MKKLAVILSLILICWKSYSQAVVTNPVLEQTARFQLTNLKAASESMKLMQEAQKKAEEVKQKVDWIKELESIQQTIILMERISCTIKDLDLNLSLLEDLGLIQGGSCWVDFNYHINFNKLRQAVDIFNIILSKGFEMERSERLKLYISALKIFEESQTELIYLESNVRYVIKRYEREIAIEKAYEEFHSPDNPRWKQYE